MPPAQVSGAIGSVLPFLTAAAGMTLDQTIDAILRSGEESIRSQVNAKRVKFDSRVNDQVGITDIGDGGDGGTSNADYAGGSIYNPTGLSFGIKPVSSNFQTNIVPLYRPKFFGDGASQTAPLILKCLNVWAEEATGRFMGQEVINNYIDNAMISAYVNSISTRLRPNSFNSGIAGNRSLITNYFKILSYALAIYYSLASIVTHFRMEENRNEGMIALYSQLTPTDIQQLGILHQTLEGLPIDPRLNEYMFHLYGNYKQDFLPGSPLVKFIPFTFQNASNNLSMSNIIDVVPNALAMLKTQNFRNVQQVFASAYPELVNSKLMGYSGVPGVDKNWNSCWVNAPYYSVSSTGSMILPAITSNDQVVDFNLHTDAPDGWIEGSSGMFNPNEDHFVGGLGAPKTLVLAGDLATSVDMVTYFGRTNQGNTGSTSAFIYTTDVEWNGTVKTTFWPLSAREENQILSGNTYKSHIFSNSINSFQRYGTERAEPRTARDSSVTTMQFIEFMYFPPSMTPSSRVQQPTAGLEMAAEDSAPKKRNRRRRSKK